MPAGFGACWPAEPGRRPGWRLRAWRSRRSVRGIEPETALHRWWRCPALDLARHQAQVGDLALRGAKCGYQPRCLWQNGILPTAATAVSASEPMLRDDSLAKWPLPGLGKRVVEAWTDGSASHPGVRQLSRAGWGLWIPGAVGGELAEPLCGSAQTAPRAEVRAFVAALEATAGAVRVWTDSRYVCNGVRYLDAGTRPPFAHRDLWERARAAWRPGISSVAWIKAHLDWEAAEEKGYPRYSWDGSKRADELAGRGAASHALADEVATRVAAAGEEVGRMQHWVLEACSWLRRATRRGPGSGA